MEDTLGAKQIKKQIGQGSVINIKEPSHQTSVSPMVLIGAIVQWAPIRQIVQILLVILNLAHKSALLSPQSSPQSLQGVIRIDYIFASLNAHVGIQQTPVHLFNKEPSSPIYCQIAVGFLFIHEIPSALEHWDIQFDLLPADVGKSAFEVEGVITILIMVVLLLGIGLHESRMVMQNMVVDSITGRLMSMPFCQLQTFVEQLLSPLILLLLPESRFPFPLFYFLHLPIQLLLVLMDFMNFLLLLVGQG